jgi:hypothetical protein
VVKWVDVQGEVADEAAAFVDIIGSDLGAA